MKCLIRNGTIVTVNKEREILYDSSLYIENDRIMDIGDADKLDLKYKNVDKVIDLKGKILFPGFVNTHNHLFQVLLKGLGDDMVLKDWLEFMTFPSTPFLTEENCYYAALGGLTEGIRSGVTTTFDYMYAHPEETFNLDEGIIKAMKELKIRGFFGRGYVNDGVQYGVHPKMIENVEKIEMEVRELYKKYNGIENGRIKIALAPAAVWSNNKESLKMTKRIADDLGILVSLHISETPFDKDSSYDLHGIPEIDILKELGLFNDNLLMVHCVHLSDDDIKEIKKSGASVSHNVMSNMCLASGVAPVRKLNEAGIPVGLGLDGAASNNSNDMIELLKVTALQHKIQNCNPTAMTAFKVLEMATIEGAKALKLDGEIGSLEIGKKADLFIFNPELDLKSIPMHNPVSSLVYSSGNKNIETVIIDGNIVMENSKLLVYDELDIARNIQRVADELSLKAGTIKLKKRPWVSIK